MNSEGVLKQVYPDSLNAYEKLQLESDYKGEWHCGTTFVNSDGMESDITVSSSKCKIGRCDGDTFDLVLNSPIMEIDWEDKSCDGFCKNPRAGLEIELVDEGTGDVIASGETDADGLLAVSGICMSDVAGKTMRAQIRAALAEANCIQCDEIPGDCLIYLAEGLTEADIDENKMGINYSVDVPKPSGAGGKCGARKEIANPTCDGDIGFADFKILKRNYKKMVAGTVSDDATHEFCCE